MRVGAGGGKSAGHVQALQLSKRCNSARGQKPEEWKRKACAVQALEQRVLELHAGGSRGSDRAGHVQCRRLSWASRTA